MTVRRIYSFCVYRIRHARQYEVFHPIEVFHPTSSVKMSKAKEYYSAATAMPASTACQQILLSQCSWPVVGLVHMEILMRINALTCVRILT